MRVTRFNASPDRLEARMEVSTDGGASSAGRLKYRRRQQPYVPLT
jgi:hypothetical protein